MKLIPLNADGDGPAVMVDDGDYDMLMEFRWRVHAKAGSATTYAVTGYTRLGTFQFMHRLILGVGRGDPSVDHANGNGLDNQRANLRLASPMQQMRNRRPNRSYKGQPRATAYKGVSYEPRSSALLPWRAAISVNKQRIRLGSYGTDHEAALAYNEAALRHYGEFAQLNEVQQLVHD